MITDGGKCYYFAATNISELLHGIKSKHNDDRYRINCLHSYKTKSKLISHDDVCKDHGYCDVNCDHGYCDAGGML